MIRRQSHVRQKVVNLSRYGEGYQIGPNNVIGSTDKFVVRYNGDRIGRFALASEAEAAIKEHKKQIKEEAKRLANRVILG